MNLAGANFDNVEIESLIAKGDESEVWRGFNHALGTPVAIKVLYPEVATKASRVNAFISEARLCVRLQHPNVQRVYTVGRFEHKGQVYRGMVMALVDGPSVAMRIKNGLTPSDAALITLQVADALKYLHDQKVYHCAVQPSAILTSECLAEIRLMDFEHLRVGDRGIAQAVPPFVDFPNVAPEVLQHASNESASDVYSLGCTLYSMLFGHPPFGEAGSPGFEAAHFDASPVIDESARNHLPDTLLDLIERMMVKEPKRRIRLKGVIDRLRIFNGVSIATPITIESRNAEPENLASESIALSLDANDAFIGREDELRAIREAFESQERVITLHGVGGIGKTRLAKQFARRALAKLNNELHFFFCDLSNAREDDEVQFVLAEALGIKEVSKDLESHIVQILASRPDSLIIIDNAEQVIARVAKIVDRIIEGTKNTRLLVTSRERLNLQSEACIPLKALPHAGKDSDAAKLFLDRAKRVSPKLNLSAGEERILVQLLAKLDGIPLAIELAAAHIDQILPSGMLELFEELLDHRPSEESYRPKRQETMWAAIRWSWDLLTKDEQETMKALSIFNGSFTLDAAEGLIDGVIELEEPMVIDLLDALVDKALLVTTYEDSPLGEARYHQLDAIRSFSENALTEEPPIEDAQHSLLARHADFFLDYIARWSLLRRRDQTPESFHAFAKERESIAMAIEWAIEHRPIDALVGLIAFDQHEFTRGGQNNLHDWFQAGLLIIQNEALTIPSAIKLRFATRQAEWQAHNGHPQAALKAFDGILEALDTESTLSNEERQAIRARIALGEANARYPLGDIENGSAAAKRALELASNDLERADAMYSEGVYFWMSGEIDKSISTLESAEAIYRSHRHFFSVAKAQNSIAISLARLGDIEDAVELYAKVRETALVFGNNRLACLAQYNAAGELCTEGEHERAKVMYEEVCKICLDLGYLSHYAYALGGLGQVYFELENYDEAESNLRMCQRVTRNMHARDAYNYYGDVLAQVLIQRERKKKGVTVDAGKLEEAHIHLAKAEEDIAGMESVQIPHLASVLGLCALYSELTRSGDANLREEYRQKANRLGQVGLKSLDTLAANLERDKFFANVALVWINDAIEV